MSGKTTLALGDAAASVGSAAWGAEWMPLNAADNAATIRVLFNIWVFILRLLCMFK
jgi:hypothetical protein